MISVKDLDSIDRYGKCDGCAEIMCVQNPRAVVGKAPPGRFRIPTDKCPNILMQIADHKVDIVLRYWMQKVFVKKKRPPTPTQLRELLKSKGVEDSMPVSAVQAVLNAAEWPPNVLDERSKESFADLHRQLTVHRCGAKHVSFVRWAEIRHNVEVTGGAPQARSPVDCRVGG